jgi:hypothetical protein
MKKYSLVAQTVGEIVPKTKNNYGKVFGFIGRNTLLSEVPEEKDFFLFMKVKAKRTDVIQDFFTPQGMLVSHRLKLILEKFKLPTHRFYPATIVHKNVEYEYHWFQINMPFERHPVNKQKTLHSEEYDPTTYGYQVGAKPIKDIESVPITTDMGTKSEVWLYQDLLPYDLFSVRSKSIRTKFCPMPFIISQELKAALIENKITGIGIIDANIQAD